MDIVNLLFPRRCVSCRKLGSYFCQKCLLKIEYINKPICPVCARPAIDGATHPRCNTSWTIDGLFALAHYKGPIRDAIHLLKYRFVSDVAESLVSLLVNYYPKTLPQFDFLTPVPLHPRRERFRGFNQSFFLAKILGTKLNISLEDKLLQRIKHVQPQVKLKGKERISNIRGVFYLNKNSQVKGKSIGLVDDVATTRSTLLECAKVLKRNGAEKVWGLVLAHG